MPTDSTHVSDVDLVRMADGEVSSHERTRIASHLTACWTCRTRTKELEEAIAGFVAAYRDGTESGFMPAGEPRARFRARLEDRARARSAASPGWAGLSVRGRCYAAAAAVGLALAVAVSAFFAWDLRRVERSSPPVEASLVRPDPGLTPGATIGVSAEQVCDARRRPSSHPDIPASVGRSVFAEYGIRDLDERAYELDYLIPPELGGSDSVRNLWPQAYSTPAWNAHVKDALEHHLYDRVCSGAMSLAAAQLEISADWIAAYRRHFGTQLPVSDHLAFLKDEPWQN